jgi:hypothetical protein
MIKDNIEEKFNILKNKWLYRIRGISDSSAIANNKYYTKIINLGFSAIPFLLKEQELKTGRYFTAIKLISYHSYNDLKELLYWDMQPLINSGTNYSVLEYFYDLKKITLYFEKKKITGYYIDPSGKITERDFFSLYDVHLFLSNNFDLSSIKWY